MEREGFFSGYCRQVDQSRTVCVEAEGSELTHTDCLFENCPHGSDCPLHKKIEDFLEDA